MNWLSFFAWIMLLIFICFLVVGAFRGYYEIELRDKECTKLGFNEYIGGVCLKGDTFIEVRMVCDIPWNPLEMKEQGKCTILKEANSD